MANSLEHLHIGVWSFLDGSVDERVSRLYAPKWVAYSRGNQALARMEHLLNHPPSGRMPTSNDTRVRVEGFSKIIARILP